MKAVVETGGKQYYVEEGSVLYVEKLDNNIDDEVELSVLSIGDQIGTPYVNGASVKAKVEKHGKNKKIVVFKYRPKKKYRKKQGHRQPYTKLVITEVKA